MRDLGRLLAAAPLHWDSARTEAGLRGLARRRLRRAATRLTAIVLAASALVIYAKRPPDPDPVPAPVAVPVPDPVPVPVPVPLPDPVPAVIEMPALSARPRVTFPIATVAGDLEIIVLSAEFSGTRERGAVQVLWRGEMLDLKPQAASRDRVDELLREADTLRRAGRGEDAAPRLREIVRRHRRDPRAPAAAFTLGRVLLAAGDARAAARAFSDARALAPRGPLAEDSLAREVEAWARAGDADRARERARLYLARHPGGARVEAVRRHAE